MSNDTQRTWTKQDAKDASRLLAELAKRAEKASGGFKRPERFESEETVPASSEKCRESERKRGEALHDSRQSTAYPAGEVTGGGLGVVAKVDGRPVFRQSFQSRVNANDDGLPNREYVIRDRTRSMLMLVTLPDVEW